VLGIISLFDRDPRKLRTGRCFRLLGRAITRVKPWKIRISGHDNLDPTQVYVVVSNHQSIADIPVIAHLELDSKWLAKTELFRVPIAGWLLRMANEIAVDRADGLGRRAAMLQCTRCLRERCSVVFFPEGTRSLYGEVLPFSKGPFYLAIREQVPILPLVLHGSGAALPRRSWIFGGTRVIQLQILQPVPVDGLKTVDSASLRDTVRKRIVDELYRLQSLEKTLNA